MRLVEFLNRPRVVLSFVLTVGATFVAMGLWAVSEQRAIARWPAATGTVVESEIVTHASSDMRHRVAVYAPRVSYRYSVAGREYRGERVGFVSWRSSDRSESAAVVARYPRGARIQVYHDPGSPDAAVLDREPSWLPWIFLVVGVLVMAIAAGVFRYLRES